MYITDMISFQVKYIQGTLDVDVISLKKEHSFWKHKASPSSVDCNIQGIKD